MKKIPAIVWLPLVFVFGGLVGYYGPAEELRSRDVRMQEEKAKPKNAFGSFTDLVNIPDVAKHPRSVKEEEPAEETDTTSAVASSGGAVAGTNAVYASTSKPRSKRVAPEDLRARIDEAAELWRTRSEVARAAAIEKLGLDENGTAAFDNAIVDMNTKLRESIQIVADSIASSDSMTKELGIRLMGDISASLAETYDALGACVGKDRRGEVSDLELVNFIDPSVGEPLIAVQDKLEDFGERPGK